MFRHQIGLHLERLASYLQLEQKERLVEPFELQRKKEYPDELRLLVDAINTMRLKLHDDIRKRETLIGEVHHRIKNDMSFVQSLLRLQASQSGLPAVEDAQEQASQRVAVMTKVYERLYLNDNFHEVEIRPLAEQVVTDLLELGRISADTVRLSADDFSVSTKASMAIGVILNELVTNALKHARAGTDSLAVNVELHRKEKDSVHLRVSDNGDGFPAELLSGTQLGYGLTVVEALVQQHNGEVTFTNSPGADVNVQIAAE